MLSIIIPSKYPRKLASLLESMQKTAANYDALEIIICLDGPDTRTQHAGNFTYTYHPASVDRMVFFEQGYKASTREWVFFANDDLIFETPGWDIIFNETIKYYNEDKIALIWPNDKIFCEKLSCFPLTSRKVMDLIFDTLSPLPFTMYKFDDTVFDVVPKERHCYLEMVVIKHNNLVHENEGVNGFSVGNGMVYPNNVEILQRDTDKFRGQQRKRELIRCLLEETIKKV